MLSINPFVELSSFISPIAMQIFVLVMVALTVGGTILDIIHKKNVKYFFNNAKKAKLSATKNLSSGQKISVVTKTIAHDILTTAELGATQRRIAHVMGMYGTVLFWIGSAVMIFKYSSPGISTPSVWPIIWHVGAIMTVVGGGWFWLFLRVDVSAEANSVFRIVLADLFVLALVAASAMGLIWSFLQTSGINGWDMLFLVLFAVANIILFGGVYWSKFAHMFYKPGAAIQKNLAKADGSNDDLPLPADAPEDFGLGISREKPKHY